jgi:hypothetical protein
MLDVDRAINHSDSNARATYPQLPGRDRIDPLIGRGAWSLRDRPLEMPLLKK